MTDKRSSDGRQDKRHPLHWPIAVVCQTAAGARTHHGRTHEMSLGGCSMLTEDNFLADQPVTVYLSAPVEQPGAPRSVLEIKARMVYTVLASGQQKFRCGFQFLNFKDNGRATLARLMEGRSVAGDY